MRNIRWACLAVWVGCAAPSGDTATTDDISRAAGESKADCVNRVWSEFPIETDEDVEHEGVLYYAFPTCTHRIAMEVCGYGEQDFNGCEVEYSRPDDSGDDGAQAGGGDDTAD